MKRDALLVAAAAGTAVFGATLVLAPALTRQGFGLLMHCDAARIDGFGPEAVAYVTLLHGVLGAVMFGWAIALLALLRGRWRVEPARARAIVALSVGGWYVVDTAFSASVGAWPNVALNSVFGALFAAGLLLARPARDAQG
jgi:hypothetical protein